MRRASPPPLLEAVPPPASPGSRARSWAGRLVLLLACASVVATSQARSDDVASEEHVGAPLSITTDAPKATRRLVIRASAPKPPAKQAFARLTVRVTARWIPTNPNETVSPWLKVIVSDGTGGTGRASSGVLTAGVPGTQEGSVSLSPDCNLEASCQWIADVGFEVQANAAPGTVELEWTAQAHAHVLDTSSVPKGFTVSVSAP